MIPKTFSTNYAHLDEPFLIIQLLFDHPTLSLIIQWSYIFGCPMILDGPIFSGVLYFQVSYIFGCPIFCYQQG
ncbi:MAG: hypothetical protein CMB80_02775 [Flammeovirgaceae bacterium]|nr:hypothetical protein [Flammeovirgaceae bacterium]